MTIPATGKLRLSDISAEFGGAVPHKLSEYTRGGSYVPSSAQASIKTSAAKMAFSDYRGAAKAIVAAFPATGGGIRYYFNGSTFALSTISSSFFTAGTYIVGASGNNGENFRISGVRITPQASSNAKFNFKLDVVATENSPGGSFSISVDNTTAAFSVYSGSWLSRSWYGTDYLVSIGFVSFSTVTKKLILDLGYSTTAAAPADGTLRVEIPFE